MEELKSLFGEESLSYAQLEQKLEEAGETIKLANLKSGNYVDKSKFDKVEKSANDYKTKYDALVESTKGYEEMSNNYNALQEKYTALEKKQEETDKMNLINSANVNPKFAKFVLTEVSSQMGDGKDFKNVLEDYLKDNKEFLNVNKGTFVDLQNGAGQPISANEKMNNLIRRK